MSEMLSSVLPGLCSGLRLTEGIMLPARRRRGLSSFKKEQGKVFVVRRLNQNPLKYAELPALPQKARGRGVRVHQDKALFRDVGRSGHACDVPADLPLLHGADSVQGVKRQTGHLRQTMQFLQRTGGSNALNHRARGPHAEGGEHRAEEQQAGDGHNPLRGASGHTGR